MEHVVAEHERDRLSRDEILAYDERLGEPVGMGLLGVLQPHAEVRPVAQEPLVLGQGDRVRYHEHLADPREHEHGERVVHQRLVVDRQQLLADRLGYGVQAGARPACEDYASFNPLCDNAIGI